MSQQQSTAQAQIEAILSRVLASDELQATMEEQYQALQQTWYLSEDEQVLKLIWSDPDLQPLIPALSRMLRTTRIEDKIEIKRLMKMWDIECRLQVMIAKPAHLKNLALFYALRQYGRGVVHDTWLGWRGNLLSRKIREYLVETGGTPRRKGILERIFR